MARKILISQTLTILACSIAAFLLGGGVSLLGIQAQNVPAGTTASIPSFTFSQDLKFGQTNTDIYWLQVTLNRDPATQIAKTGIGSPGKESKYYGNLTKKAVAKFETKYLSHTKPTGLVVNAEIRTKLNAIIAPTLGTLIPGGNSAAAVGSAPIAGVQALLDKVNSDLHVYSVTPYQAKPGETITINGNGFDAYNTVYFGTIKLENVPAMDSKTIVIASTTVAIPIGDYSVVVQNSSGFSKGSNDQTIRFRVTDSPEPSPEAYSVSPITASPSDTLTITGKNFSQNGNSVFSPYGKVVGLPSYDGTHITVPLRPLVEQLINAPEIQKLPAGTTVKVSLRVVTIGGVSPIAVSIELRP